jgi:hypothetical protein
MTTDALPTSTSASQIVQEGYTGGAMAGLAVAMIIIAGPTGLLLGFLLGKRNTIAYKVQDWSASEVDKY